MIDDRSKTEIVGFEGNSTSTTWVTVFKDGRLELHHENSGWHYRTCGPEASNDPINLQDVVRMGLIDEVCHALMRLNARPARISSIEFETGVEP